MSYRHVACFAFAVSALITSSCAQKEVDPFAVNPDGNSRKGGAAAPASSPGGSKAEQILNTMQQQYAQVRGVQGSFSQTRVDPTFKEEIKSDATFQMLKPNYFRVEFAAPRVSTNVLAGNTFYRYEPGTKNFVRSELKRDALSKDLGYLMLGFGARTADVLANFSATASASGKEITLVPRNPKASDYKQIIMQITENYRPQKFTMSQADGTRVVVNIDAKSLNLQAPLTERNFDPSSIAPRGVKPVDM